MANETYDVDNLLGWFRDDGVNHVETFHAVNEEYRERRRKFNGLSLVQAVDRIVELEDENAELKAQLNITRTPLDDGERRVRATVGAMRKCLEGKDDKK